MNIHEYQAKEILKKFGANVPNGVAIFSLDEIESKAKLLKSKKDETQPTKIKTGGSTFKNPIDQTNKKVWELIRGSVPLDTRFGDAIISEKHCNFFINKDKATFEDMKKLINFVKDKVFTSTGIKLSLEIILVE